jgi:hypothetical protein
MLICYTCVMIQVPRDRKAFLGLQCTSLDPRADQINLDQGTEPPFLTMALTKPGKTAIILKGSTSANSTAAAVTE